ncbi:MULTISPECIES: ParA family protein [unclassified Thioalkalivibrio]|uniref:ParA family protein n=1 Tax=unclassified Thioalkalivibrio TaxID=2621013 RepID=UPI000368604B|nr:MULTISPECIES: ParA family protein [unclassified Thioalkalivibrio]
MKAPGGLRVISVVNNKGGVGKTSMAKAISEYFAIVHGKSVLGIDVDAQCSYSLRYLEMEAESDSDGSYKPPVSEEFDPNDPEMAGWNGRSCSADLYMDMTYGVTPYETPYHGIHVLPGWGSKLRTIELVRREEVELRILARMREFLWTEDIADIYDIVVIDTPPAKSPVTRSVLRASTDLVIPTKLDQVSMEGVYGMLRFYKDEKHRRGGDDTPLNLVGILPNMVRKNTRQTKQMIASLMGEGSVLSEYVLPHSVGLRTAFDAVNAKEDRPDSVFQLSQNDPARVEAQAACDEIWRRMNANG